MVLIVTFKEDPHPTKVIQSLRKRNVSVFRLNTDTFLSDYDVVWNNSCNCGFKIKNIHTGLTIYESEISTVWLRRAFKPRVPREPNSEEITNHNLVEAKGFLEYVYNDLVGKFSIGSYLYDDVANSKILQLKVAQELGLKVPHTCFSNQKSEIMRLANSHEWLLLKSIKNDFVMNGVECQQVFYAQKVKSELIKDLPNEAFSQTVSFVQNYIDKAFELRITVVCDDVFACKIDSQKMSDTNGKVDWRQGVDEGMKHEAFTSPAHISDFCRKYLRRMHLNFGCFDFIVTPQGDYVFLECNPNGQWLWIEELTGLPISESIAKHLILGK